MRGPLRDTNTKTSSARISRHNLVKPARRDVRVDQRQDRGSDKKPPLDAGPDVLAVVTSGLGKGKCGRNAG
eukprot:3687089-Pyramimonas_sp.AAC.1